MAAPQRRPRVCYFYDNEIGSYYYGALHPMKPHRLRLTHTLCMSYGLLRKMEVYRPHIAAAEEIMQFHTVDYVKFLQSLSPDRYEQLADEMKKYNVGPDGDCPAFDGVFEFSQSSAGGSIDGAIKLNHGQCDLAVNWAGGLHHAKKAEASGFCYVNDIVLGILELLKYHARVVYIDIDIHHGDGVEEAFYTTDRVMTVSFHRFGFFPGTGDIKDTGFGQGRNYAVNVPLHPGADDRSFRSVFEPVIDKVMTVYRPGAVVLQCGADSIGGDRIGDFTLSVRGHGECVEFVKKYGVPTLVLGGGGYNIRNVARAWTYETAVCVGEAASLANNIPYNEYFQYFGPDFKLHTLSNLKDYENRNTPAHLEAIKETIFEQLRHLGPAPSVQMHQVPADMHVLVSKEEMHSFRPADVRMTRELSDALGERPDEHFAGDKDNRGNPSGVTASDA